jgi:hypothetical protein
MAMDSAAGQNSSRVLPEPASDPDHHQSTRTRSTLPTPNLLSLQCCSYARIIVTARGSAIMHGWPWARHRASKVPPYRYDHARRARSPPARARLDLIASRARFLRWRCCPTRASLGLQRACHAMRGRGEEDRVSCLDHG